MKGPLSTRSAAFHPLPAPTSNGRETKSGRSVTTTSVPTRPAAVLHGPWRCWTPSPSLRPVSAR